MLIFIAVIRIGETDRCETAYFFLEVARVSQSIHASLASASRGVDRFEKKGYPSCAVKLGYRNQWTVYHIVKYYVIILFVL